MQLAVHNASQRGFRSAAASAPSSPQLASPVSESHLANGVIKPQYQRLSTVFGHNVLAPGAELQRGMHEWSRREGTPYSAVPLLLSASDLKLIRTGTAQIARVLTEFFADLAFGQCEVLQRGIVPREVAEQLGGSAGQSLQKLRELWQGKNRSDITFALGLDLVRDHAGRIRLLEVNVGYIGGVSDAFRAPDHYLTVASATAPSESSRKAIAALKSAVQSPGFFLDALFAKFGVRPDQTAAYLGLTEEELDPRNRTVSADRDEEDPAWGARLKQLGGACFRYSARRADLPSEVKLVLNRTFAEDDAVLWRRGVGLLNAPGTDEILSNKLLLPYLAKLTQHYLRENMILTPPPSGVAVYHKRGISGVPSLRALDEPRSRPVSTHFKDGIVFKSPAGRSGKEVAIIGPGGRFYPHLFDTWNGSGMVSSRRDSGAGRLLLTQQFVHVSQLLGSRVDFRPIAYVIGDGECVVGNRPLCRGQQLNAGAAERQAGFKTNIAQGALVHPVLCADDL